MEVGWGLEEGTGFSGNEHSNYRIKSPLQKKGYCFDFQRTGACSRKNCKFMHINSDLLTLIIVEELLIPKELNRVNLNREI